MSTAQNTTLKTGTVLEKKWIIIELIGKGPMGEVYWVHQTTLKLLHRVLYSGLKTTRQSLTCHHAGNFPTRMSTHPVCHRK